MRAITLFSANTVGIASVDGKYTLIFAILNSDTCPDSSRSHIQGYGTNFLLPPGTPGTVSYVPRLDQLSDRERTYQIFQMQ